MWAVRRSRGRPVEAGGTLVVGREQDCLGGCFDSAASGPGAPAANADEYGPQDFFGEIDELRIWGVARSQAQIVAAMDSYGLTKGEGLIASYSFDEGRGNVIRDITGNGNDLVLATDRPHFQPSTVPEFKQARFKFLRRPGKGRPLASLGSRAVSQI